MLARRVVIGWVAAASLAAAPAQALAQTQTPTAPADSGSSNVGLFETRDLYWAAGFVAAAAALAPLDRQIARVSQRPALQANRILSHGSVGARLLGSPGAIILGGAVYGAGRASGNHNMARLGLHTAEAVFIGDMITGAIKNVAGRKRPYLSPDNPYDFRLFRGFKGDSVRSFPSGHTTSAFAAAAAATAETGYIWKGGKPYVGTVLFGAASIVGVSRMYNNAHWASDVAIGAAIGSFVGWKVVRYSHQHPSNSFDRLFLARDDDRGGVTPPLGMAGTAAIGTPGTIGIGAPGPRARATPVRPRTLLRGMEIPITFSIRAP